MKILMSNIDCNTGITIIGLCGRNMPAEIMFEFCCLTKIESTIAIIEPTNMEWYSAPNGPLDQENSVRDIKKSRKLLLTTIKKINRINKIPQKIAIIGYSAGAVMALDLIGKTRKEFLAVCCLSGAILEPEKLPKAKNKTPILLRHNYDDLCFSWEERYIPMKKALSNKNYNFKTLEHSFGGHNVTKYDANVFGKFISSFL